MQKVTAVILNYNSNSDCRKCISFLKKQDYANLELIVVDNASPNPAEKETLSTLCMEAHVKLIANKRNVGFSAGNNIGLREAVANGAKWLVVINPDVELRDPHYISYVMEQIPNWPDAAVIGTNTLLSNGEKQNPMREVRCFEEIFWPLEIIKQKIGMWDGYRSKDETGYCDKVSGCCFFVSKKFLEANGYLDENVFMYCEEPILGKSVLNAGFKVLYIKEITANHEHYVHKKEGNSQSKMPLFLRSRIYYIENYSGYSRRLKYLAKASRKLQMKIWEKKK